MDYSKCVIYKIVCTDLVVKDVYVGHTTDLRVRRNKHKSDCNCETAKGHNIHLYQIIRANGGWLNWQVIEIEKFPCIDKNEATSRERHFMEQLNANLNTLCPVRTREENLEYWSKIYTENREAKIEDQKKRYEKNKEDILKKHKVKYDCECGGKYTHADKQKHFRTNIHKTHLQNITDNILDV